MIILLFSCLHQVALGHVELTENGLGSTVAALVENWNVDNHDIALARHDILKDVVGEETVSFLHLVLEKGVKAVLASTRIISEF